MWWGTISSLIKYRISNDNQRAVWVRAVCEVNDILSRLLFAIVLWACICSSLKALYRLIICGDVAVIKTRTNNTSRVDCFLCRSTFSGLLIATTCRDVAVIKMDEYCCGFLVSKNCGSSNFEGKVCQPCNCYQYILWSHGRPHSILTSLTTRCIHVVSSFSKGSLHKLEDSTVKVWVPKSYIR